MVRNPRVSLIQGEVIGALANVVEFLDNQVSEFLFVSFISTNRFRFSHGFMSFVTTCLMLMEIYKTLDFNFILVCFIWFHRSTLIQPWIFKPLLLFVFKLY